MSYYIVRLREASYQVFFPDTDRGKELTSQWIVELLSSLPYDPFEAGSSITITRQGS